MSAPANAKAMPPIQSATAKAVPLHKSATAKAVPFDIVTYILEYVPDPDIRRAFGIYRPLSTTQYTPLLSIQRTPFHTESYYRFHFVRYSLPNICNPVERDLQDIDPDHMDVEFWMNADEVLYDIAIHRLKEQDPDNTKMGNVYYKGTLNTYYWDTVNISYDSNWATILP
jgi:hypothetical protein